MPPLLVPPLLWTLKTVPPPLLLQRGAAPLVFSRGLKQGITTQKSVFLHLIWLFGCSISLLWWDLICFCLKIRFLHLIWLFGCSTRLLWWDLICFLLKNQFFNLIWLFPAEILFSWCNSSCLCLYLVTRLLVSLAYWIFPTTIIWFLVNYLLATMSETTSSSYTMISSLMVETSIPKIMLGTMVKLNGSNNLYGRRCFIYSLALKTIGSPPSKSTCYFRSYLCNLAS